MRDIAEVKWVAQCISHI